MGSGSPRARRASGGPKSPNKAAGAAADPAGDRAEQPQDAKRKATAAAPAAVHDDGDDGAAAAPPAAKRARKERQPKAGSKGGGAAAVDDSAHAPAEAGDKAAPARVRKPRTKAAAQESGGGAAAAAAAAAAAGDSDEGGSGGGGGGDGEGAEGGAVLGGRAAKPKAKSAGKRGQKAEPLPQYTSALRKPPPPEGTPALKILSWNVAGLRALLKKTPDAISSLVAREGVDVVCLQEHKLQSSHTAEMEAALGLKGWHHHWACSTGKLGYSGVSVHTRAKPLSVTIGLAAIPTAQQPPDPEHDLEGRLVAVELPAPGGSAAGGSGGGGGGGGLFVVSAYVPNSGEGLKRLDYRINRWDGAFASYIRALEARGKPVVLTGDLNCAHQEIDIHAPKTNLRSAGFTPEERESFGRLLLGEVGLVDTFRTLHPGTVAYTYFTRRFNCRAQNKGWRLDYFLTSGALVPPAAAASAAAEAAAAAAEHQPEAAVAASAGAAASTAAAPTGAAAAGGAPLSTPWRVYDSWILQDVYGSDHLPLGLTLTLTT